ncbi:hypothetical protein [Chitinophaga pinensis]|uniref:Uncharacterized protein n=1 Tax=Chitinophaga pinensis (strain ATCC 43595 / DSM 2588 / LMG 13176 / NBRC 15968 / NCIMB 11800 / UQM 2034) TaxID=485918 RepID=A0A979G5Y1_CHIPD|nr:hypothetical protein [Chitinophaga pinensis]ACU61330.1 hypothetical protein Cpin_3868 [Chitinophaga pinensis DSM 2588]
MANSFAVSAEKNGKLVTKYPTYFRYFENHFIGILDPERAISVSISYDGTSSWLSYVPSDLALGSYSTLTEVEESDFINGYRRAKAIQAEQEKSYCILEHSQDNHSQTRTLVA